MATMTNKGTTEKPNLLSRLTCDRWMGKCRVEVGCVKQLKRLIVEQIIIKKREKITVAQFFFDSRVFFLCLSVSIFFSYFICFNRLINKQNRQQRQQKRRDQKWVLAVVEIWTLLYFPLTLTFSTFSTLEPAEILVRSLEKNGVKQRGTIAIKINIFYSLKSFISFDYLKSIY